MCTIWSNKWQLQFNTWKYKVMHIGPINTSSNTMFDLIFFTTFWLPQNCWSFLRDTLIRMMLIPAFLHIWSRDHCEPRNKVGSLSTTKHLVRFELRTSWCWLQHLNPLGHFPTPSDHNHTELEFIAKEKDLWIIFDNYLKFS